VTRDADFNNNGAVGAEDYTYLTSAWLTSSSCSCSPLLAGGPGPDKVLVANTRKLSRLDFNRDGLIDHKDVRIFERRHGLASTLSAAMR